MSEAYTWYPADEKPSNTFPINMIDSDGFFHVGIYTEKYGMGFSSFLKGKKKGSFTLVRVDNVVEWCKVVDRK